MIYLNEHYGFKAPKAYPYDISEYNGILGNKHYSKFFKGRKSDHLCFSLNFNGNQDDPKYLFETSYYIGTDWIVQNKLPIHVEPKLNYMDREINYLQMLSEAIRYTENINHLENLFEIDFNRPMIKINQSKDLLSPLLVIQFLNLVKKIVQKGLKKSYYKVEENLNSRVKGKIRINETIKRNHFYNKRHFTVCRYEVYGFNSIENRILKKTLIFIREVISKIRGIDTQELYNIFYYVFPAFSQVSGDIRTNDIKQFKSTPFFKEYEQAIKLAQLILKKYGYNISKVGSDSVNTPPYWIDMSKLFELYVFGKLREVFSFKGEIKYQEKVYYRELDYLIKSKSGLFKIIVDAKYKPQYERDHIHIDDIRQISGYARMSKVYDILEVDKEKNIDCLLVYPSQSKSKTDFKGIDFTNHKHRVKEYENIYAIGISLPEI